MPSLHRVQVSTPLCETSHDDIEMTVQESVVPPPALNLETLLADESGRAALFEFAKSEYSSENVEFLFEVDDFIARWHGRDDTARKEHFDLIVREFLQANAPREVSLGHSKNQRLVATTACSHDIFNDARKTVAISLEHDVFPRFLKSLDN